MLRRMRARVAAVTVGARRAAARTFARPNRRAASASAGRQSGT